MTRAVDAAMAEGRPEKKTIRDLWLTFLTSEQPSEIGSPLYLTLPGESGAEVALLIEAGTVRCTSTGAIENDDNHLIVAVESSPNAVVELKRRFPGLDVVGASVESLLAGIDRTTMPRRTNRKRCLAKIVNFDFNGPLKATTHHGVTVWTQIELVAKLAMLHREQPEPWMLFLTFNAETSWSRAVRRDVVVILRANVKQSSRLAASARRLFGDQRFDEIIQRSELPDTLEARERQALLMMLVPKRIAKEVAPIGWRLETLENIRYGDSSRQAAMVTWIFRFDWDERAASAEQLVYGDSLEGVLGQASEVTSDGKQVRLDV